MKKIALFAIATLCATALFAGITGAAPMCATGTSAKVVLDGQHDWIDLLGIDREKATLIMMDFICAKRREKKSIGKNELVRQLFGIVKKNSAYLAKPTVPYRFDHAASNHCMRVVSCENFTIPAGCTFAWDGKDAERRVFRSHKFRNGGFVFLSDYRIEHSRFLYFENGGYDVFVPTRSEDGKNWRYRSLSHQGESIVFQFYASTTVPIRLRTVSGNSQGELQCFTSTNGTVETFLPERIDGEPWFRSTTSSNRTFKVRGGCCNDKYYRQYLFGE